MKTLFVVVVLSLLTGCGFRETGGGPDSSKKYWVGGTVREFRLEDGTRCVTASGVDGKGVAISCEWKDGVH